VTPGTQPALGVGLTNSYLVTDDDDLDPGTVAVSLAQPIATASVDKAIGQFTLTGVVAGDTSLVVRADDQAVHYPFSVTAVASTSLFVTRQSTGGTLPAVTSPVQVFTGEMVPVDQSSVGPDQTPVSGAAALQLAAGLTAVTAVGDTTYDTGQVAGAATIAAPLGTLELDVVDASAMVDFTLLPAGSAITLDVDASDDQNVFLEPVDAAGRPIIGRGPEPTYTIADPSIARVDATSLSFDNVRYLGLVAVAAGTTTLDLTWGTVHKQLGVVVR
jgi:hypothetical protein